ncbi:MAG: 2TM domain-containing protein [Aureibaculum sp.]|nr:2TM domain-containing protein [Aureibaculum sp.]
MEDFTKENKYLKAKKRVEELKGFYSNLIAYVLVISFLAGINYYSSGWDHPWFLWPAFGWGIGIVFHAIGVFRMNPFLSKDWEQRKINEFMQEDETGPRKRQRWE